MFPGLYTLSLSLSLYIYIYKFFLAAIEMEDEMKKKLLIEKVEKPGGERQVEDEREEEEGDNKKLKEKVWREIKKLWIVAGPAIFSRFSTFGVNIISQAFIGHIGSTELAAFALVSTVILRFANGILVISHIFFQFSFLYFLFYYYYFFMQMEA